MDDLILSLFVCLTIPIAMSMLVLEGRSRNLVLFMVFGMFMCLFASQVNGFIQGITYLDTYTMTTSVTPIVEEILKFIPIIVFYLLFKPKQQYLLECALMVGIGFSLLENGFILLNSTEVTFAMAFCRGLGSAMLHVVTTVCVALGLSIFGIKKKTIITGTYATLLAVMVFHGIYNMFVQSSTLIYFGVILPVIVFVSIAIYGAKNKKNFEKAK